MYFWEDFFEWMWILLKIGVVALLVILGIKACTETDSWKEAQRQEAAQARIDAVPHLIREVDGCKVYRFKDQGYWRYITRCPETTTTEAERSIRSGKTTHKQFDSITTENGN